ncbi:MAG: outer membrane lipoprotein chaperone LolA [Burkholderiaceae bacterium]
MRLAISGTAMVTTSMMAIGSSLLLTTVPVYANALEQFKRFVTETRAARGEFTQRMVKGEGDKLRVSSQSSGTFAFARPGKFIWNYKKPYEQVLQSDGNTMYIHDQDLNQVAVRALGNAIGSSPAAILFGSNDLEKNFTLSDAGNKEGIDWLQAIPKTKDTQFERIGIGLRDGLPVGMELRDSFGQVSVINFTRFEKNPSLPANQFKFVMPKGADLLQQ